MLPQCSLGAVVAVASCTVEHMGDRATLVLSKVSVAIKGLVAEKTLEGQHRVKQS